MVRIRYTERILLFYFACGGERSGLTGEATHTGERMFEIEYLDKRLENGRPFEHYHGVYEIAFFIKAKVEIFVSDLKYEIRDGDVLFINAYDIHRVFYHPDFHYIRYVIYFDKRWVRELLQAAGCPALLDDLERSPVKRFATDLKQRAWLTQLCGELLETWRLLPPGRRTGHPGLKLNLTLLLVRIQEMKEAQKHQYKHDKKDRKIRSLIEYMDANYQSPLQLDNLEAFTGLNKYYLSHVFKQMTGLSIVEYLHYRRVTEAQKLLRQTDKPIADICFDCGFQSLQHFGRVFRRIAKLTPSQYRGQR